MSWFESFTKPMPFILTFLIMISYSDGTCRNLQIDTIKKGQVLVNHTIRTVQPIKDIEACASRCYLEQLCFTFNYCETQSSGSLCELIDSDHIRHGQHLVKKSGCTYYGSESACSSSPCVNNATCQGDFAMEEKPYQCICPVGFTGQKCEMDIDECESKSSCHMNATCTNAIGGHSCVCKEGFHGNGETCEDVDECTSNLHDCHVNATCTNTIGGHSCVCKEGFHGNGKTCEDVDECASNLHDCHVNAKCNNIIGGYNCTCKTGFLGNGMFCRWPLSCDELKQLLSNDAVSGTYKRELNGGNVGIVFCSYKSYTGCGQGPWTLVIKIDGSKKNFKYESQVWDRKAVFNPDGGPGGLDNQETVSPAYWSTPLKKLCLGMKENNDVKWISINITAESLHHIMASKQQVSTNLGEAKWRSLLTKTSMQPNCNMEGFNLVCEGDGTGKRRLRLGFFTNNENDCRSCNSYVGLGPVDANNNQPVCGNYGSHSKGDNGELRVAAFCYIFIK